MNLNPSIELKAAEIIDYMGNVYARNQEVRVPAEKVLFAVQMGDPDHVKWHVILEGNWRIVVQDVDKIEMQTDNPLGKRKKKNEQQQQPNNPAPQQPAPQSGGSGSTSGNSSQGQSEPSVQEPIHGTPADLPTVPGTPAPGGGGNIKPPRPDAGDNPPDVPGNGSGNEQQLPPSPGDASGGTNRGKQKDRGDSDAPVGDPTPDSPGT